MDMEGDASWQCWGGAGLLEGKRKCVRLPAAVDGLAAGVSGFGPLWRIPLEQPDFA